MTHWLRTTGIWWMHLYSHRLVFLKRQSPEAKLTNRKDNQEAWTVSFKTCMQTPTATYRKQIHHLDTSRHIRDVPTYLSYIYQPSDSKTADSTPRPALICHDITGAPHDPSQDSMGHIKHFPWKPVWTGRWTQPRDWSRFLTPWETDWQRMRPHRRRSFASGGKGHTHSKTQVFQRWGGSVSPFVARKITATAVSTIKGSQ